MSDILKSIGSKILRKATKKAAPRTGDYAGNKGGNKIVELLRKNKTIRQPVMMKPTISPSEQEILTAQEINNRVNQILSGGKLRIR